MGDLSFKVNINYGNYKSIEDAEKIFGKLSKEIQGALDDAISDAAKLMEQEVEQQLNDYGLGGSEVANSVEIVKTKKGLKLIAKSDHADFVEYGTGIVGEMNPHPAPEDWEYDTNMHGKDGWWYETTEDDPNPTKWFSKTRGEWVAHTQGLPSRPFMYNTWLYGQRIIGARVNDRMKKLAKESGL